jgi:D-3-phosphoglycerate dehydrogenase
MPDPSDSKRVILTISEMRHYHDRMIELLESHGFEVKLETVRKKVPETVIEQVRGYHAAVVGMEPYNDEVLASLAKDLRIIARFGIGYDAIDVEAATRHGVAVTNTAGMTSTAVAETALTLLLTVAKGIGFYDRRMRTGEWSRSYVGTQLEKKTVGIVGFGNIGQKLARFLRGFSCSVLAYDFAFNHTAAEELSVKQSSLDEIAEQSDFISLHLPLTDQTRGIVDRDFLSKMKDSAYLINTSRGGVVAEADLIEALMQKRIAGAGLDVFEPEPIEPSNPLLKMDNVVVSPHIASLTLEGVSEVGVRCAENIVAHFEGQTPPNLLNPGFEKNRS